jgi:DNA-binding transcriptional ArsR family regulator
MTQPAISKHLRVLREAGLVAARAEAQYRIYHLRPEKLREVDDWLARYRKFWDERLDALQAFVEEGEPNGQ